MSKVGEHVICEVCGGGKAILRHVTRAYGRGETLLIIEGVPMISCPDCGESYFTAETLKRIAELRSQSRVREMRQVPVAAFS